jgi:hypothetical protein
MADDKKDAPAPKLVKARVLIQMGHEGETYAPNDIISASAAAIKAYEAQGSVDSNADAVAYVEGLAAKAKAKADAEE